MEKYKEESSALPTTPTTTTRMAQVQGNNLLDVLKKKMRQTKEEMEKYKEESEDMARKLQVEIRRREEAEGEVAALNRRIQLLEEDLERSEERRGEVAALNRRIQLLEEDLERS